jgi:DNA-binding Lrp family transcriptional regulator
MPAIKSYVLIVTDPVKTKEVYAALCTVPEIVEVHEVMGPYDIVCEIEVEDITQIPPILSERVRRLAGVESTTSLVTFPERAG